MDVAHGNSQGIPGIDWQNVFDTQEITHHMLDLRLFGTALAHHCLLYLTSGILMHS
jgi:hypothetical protein